MTTLAVSQSGARGRPLRAWDYFTLNIYWFALSFLWNSMGPILLPSLVPLLVPEAYKGSALGALAALGLLVAIVVQPAAGAWTDRPVSNRARAANWGRRKPYIVGGTLLDVIFLLAMAFAGNYAALLTAYLLLQFSSNIAHGPYQGYIPDLVPESKRGAVSGVARLFEIVGIIVTSLATGALVGQGQIALAFFAIIACLLLCMAITALFVVEQPFTDDTPTHTAPVRPEPLPAAVQPTSPLQALFYSRDFVLWLACRLLILLGGNLVRNYALYFFGDVLRLPNPAAEVGNLLAIIAVAIAIVVYPAGALSDRWGRKSLTVLSGLLGAAGSFVLVTAGTMLAVLIGGAIIGVSTGIFLSVNWAWAIDLVPAAAGGRLLGVSNLATAGSGVLAGIGGYLLDYFNAQSHNLGYTVLYAGAALCYLAGTAVALRVPDPRRGR